jgi:hypothetical protein
MRNTLFDLKHTEVRQSQIELIAMAHGVVAGAGIEGERTVMGIANALWTTARDQSELYSGDVARTILLYEAAMIRGSADTAITCGKAALKIAKIVLGDSDRLARTESREPLYIAAGSLAGRCVEVATASGRADVAAIATEILAITPSAYSTKAQKAIVLARISIQRQHEVRQRAQAAPTHPKSAAVGDSTGDSDTDADATASDEDSDADATASYDDSDADATAI